MTRRFAEAALGVAGKVYGLYGNLPTWAKVAIGVVGTGIGIAVMAMTGVGAVAIAAKILTAVIAPTVIGGLSSVAVSSSVAMFQMLAGTRADEYTLAEAWSAFSGGAVDSFGLAGAGFGVSQGVSAAKKLRVSKANAAMKADFYVGPNGTVAETLDEYDWYTSNMGNPVGVAGHGNTGRSLPNSLTEQMAMYQVQSNPLENATRLPFNLGDSRWLSSDGWVKMQSVVESANCKTVIHYVYNTMTGAFDDFKFK